MLITSEVQWDRFTFELYLGFVYVTHPSLNRVTSHTVTHIRSSTQHPLFVELLAFFCSVFTTAPKNRLGIGIRLGVRAAHSTGLVEWRCSIE